MCVFYVRTLQDTVWPDDKLSSEPRPQYSTQQKDSIKDQATQCLADFLPGEGVNCEELLITPPPRQAKFVMGGLFKHLCFNSYAPKLVPIFYSAIKHG